MLAGRLPANDWAGVAKGRRCEGLALRRAGLAAVNGWAPRIAIPPV